MSYRVKFWGVRGSIACPSPNHVVYGGNTSCVEMTVGGHVLVFDAGTGIRALGQEIMRRDVHEATLLMTHSHWDHINGFPFFAPAFKPGFRLSILAGHLRGDNKIEDVLSSQMATPMFPVPLGAMRAQLTFHDFVAGDTLDLHEGVRVRTAELNHPNNATAYRVDHDGHSVCYVTDTEHVPGHPDANVLALIAGADLVIYDCTYTDAEWPAKIGWGHSTWQEGVRLCRAAGVRRLAIFHHDPDHDDSFMEALEDQARQEWDSILVARDNMELTVG